MRRRRVHAHLARQHDLLELARADALDGALDGLLVVRRAARRSPRACARRVGVEQRHRGGPSSPTRASSRSTTASGVVVGLDASADGQARLAALARERHLGQHELAGGSEDHSGDAPPSGANAKPPTKTGPAAAGRRGSRAGVVGERCAGRGRARGRRLARSARARAPRSRPPRRARRARSRRGRAARGRRSGRPARRARRTAALRSSSAGTGTVTLPARRRRSRRARPTAASTRSREPLGVAAPRARSGHPGVQREPSSPHSMAKYRLERHCSRPARSCDHLPGWTLPGRSWRPAARWCRGRALRRSRRCGPSRSGRTGGPSPRRPRSCRRCR